MSDIRNNSLWWSTLPTSLTTSTRPTLHDRVDVDVAIVGAGYTGLWTAYYLQHRDPSLRIAIVDANFAGFGASGRNGGWCSALFPTSIDKLAREHGPAAARAMQDTMHETVREVGEVISAEGIDCDFEYSGTLIMARTKLQWQRAQEEIQNWNNWGYGSNDYALLDAAQASERIKATNVFGATYTPHCAALHPAKLVRQLAEIVEKRGATIYEYSPVEKIEPGVITTEHGQVRASYIVRATEGYTQSIAGQKRDLAPIYSLMIATEPLSDATWNEIGLAKRETFSDYRNLIIYGQRTADNRFAFGGRGAPYHFGSSIKNDYDQNQKVQESIFEVLRELFPIVANATVTHRWGGPLGIARDWMASAGLDRSTGLAWAGGYVGDGVGTSNLSGRTLADLITGTESELTSLPWVNHKSPKWEPEPLRWIGANAGLKVMTIADHTEDKTGKPSRTAGFVGKFLGH